MTPRPAEKPRPVPAAQTVQAPVVSVPDDPDDNAGLVTSTSRTESAGPGTAGGIGAGIGSGSGEGEGSGLGAGTGGGTGGGPYRAGSGIEPPRIIREVRPSYTDEARRRALEGEVVLEIVVMRDGRVGNVRITRALGAGLDQKAMEAVRQFRFAPARRGGTPVDVVVDVSVGFSLR
jgi:TonB family protein